MTMYLYGNRVVEARRMRSTWESMKETAKWLALSGVPYRLTREMPVFDDDDDEASAYWVRNRLPVLRIYDQHMQLHRVFPGNYLVKRNHNDVSIVPSQKFLAEARAL
jgi:hypothetical protein